MSFCWTAQQDSAWTMVPGLLFWECLIHQRQHLRWTLTVPGFSSLILPQMTSLCLRGINVLSCTNSQAFHRCVTSASKDIVKPNSLFLTHAHFCFLCDRGSACPSFLRILLPQLTKSRSFSTCRGVCSRSPTRILSKAPRSRKGSSDKHETHRQNIEGCVVEREKEVLMVKNTTKTAKLPV